MEENREEFKLAPSRAVKLDSLDYLSNSGSEIITNGLLTQTGFQGKK